MAIIKKTNDNKYWQISGKKGNPSRRNVNGTTTMESSMEVPQGIKNKITV